MYHMRVMIYIWQKKIIVTSFLFLLYLSLSWMAEFWFHSKTTGSYDHDAVPEKISQIFNTG